ncbi:MAG: hypothetical protein ABI371_05930 [Gelidibacter sp.]
MKFGAFTLYLALVFAAYSSDDDIEMKGPFEIDLLSGNLIPIINVEILNVIYQ